MIVVEMSVTASTISLDPSAIMTDAEMLKHLTAVDPTVNMIVVEMSVEASLPSASMTDVKRSTTLMTFINIYS